MSLEGIGFRCGGRDVELKDGQEAHGNEFDDYPMNSELAVQHECLRYILHDEG